MYAELNIILIFTTHKKTLSRKSFTICYPKKVYQNCDFERVEDFATYKQVYGIILYLLKKKSSTLSSNHNLTLLVNSIGECALIRANKYHMILSMTQTYFECLEFRKIEICRFNFLRYHNLT